MWAEFKAVRNAAREDFRGLRGEIGALHRLMIQAFSGLGSTVILGFAALLLRHTSELPVQRRQTMNLPSSCITTPSTSSLPPRRRSQTRSVWTADSLVPPDSG
jgi:hypothetical protein